MEKEGKCFLCLKNCHESCSHGHFYCCDDHLRAHGVGDYCFPFEIQESEEFGRYKFFILYVLCLGALFTNIRSQIPYKGIIDMIWFYLNSLKFIVIRKSYFSRWRVGNSRNLW